MNNTRNPTKNGQTDVDQEVGVAASLEEDRKGWQEESEEVQADVAGGGGHDDVCGLDLVVWYLSRWRKAECWIRLMM